MVDFSGLIGQQQRFSLRFGIDGFFLVPTAIGKGEDAKWPAGDAGRALDWLLLAALALMTGWVTVVLVRQASV